MFRKATAPPLFCKEANARSAKPPAGEKSSPIPEYHSGGPLGRGLLAGRPVRLHPAAADRLGYGGAIKNGPRRLGHAGKDPPDLAGGFIFAVGTTAIGDFAEAGERRDGAVDEPENAAEVIWSGRASKA